MHPTSPTFRLRPLAFASLAALMALGSPASGEGIPLHQYTPATTESLAPDIAAYRQHVTTVANPFFEGRAPGTRGNRLAAEYIEFQFRKAGLEPPFPAGTPETLDEKTVMKEAPPSAERASYRQPFLAARSLRPGDSSKLVERGASYTTADGTVIALAPGEQYNVIGYSGNGEVSGPLAFVGYSIVSESREYDTYELGEGGKPVDLHGKIAVLFRFEPMNDEGKSRWAGSGWSPAAGLDRKLSSTAAKGAAGIILVNPPGADDDRTNKLEDLGLSGNRALDIPVVMLSISAADALVKAADAQGRSLLDLRKLADEKGGVIDLPNATASLQAKIERVPLWTDNIGGILKGKGDLASEYIVIGAHYDHVGYGYFGSRDRNPKGKLHPGADDNASGTSGMVLLSKKLAAAYAELPDDQPRRSILFMGFSGEEAGLDGSKHYVRHPITELDKHYCMINLDMIGRLREDRLSLQGVYTAEGFKDWMQPYIDAAGMNIALKKGGSGPSDHASFFSKKIPVMFFDTGLHAEYHMPTDTYDTINCEGAARICDLIYRVTLDMARRPEPLPYADGTAKPAVEHAADKGTDPNIGAVATGVRFGIAPGDYTGTEPGVLVGEVFEGLPAAKAGLKEGDLIIKWNGTQIKDVEEWMPLLQAHKPGDVVKIVYIRDKQQHETEATLVARSRRDQ